MPKIVLGPKYPCAFPQPKSSTVREATGVLAIVGRQSHMKGTGPCSGMSEMTEDRTHMESYDRLDIAVIKDFLCQAGLTSLPHAVLHWQVTGLRSGFGGFLPVGICLGSLELRLHELSKPHFLGCLRDFWEYDVLSGGSLSPHFCLRALASSTSA